VVVDVLNERVEDLAFLVEEEVVVVGKGVAVVVVVVLKAMASVVVVFMGCFCFSPGGKPAVFENSSPRDSLTTAAYREEGTKAVA